MDLVDLGTDPAFFNDYLAMTVPRPKMWSGTSLALYFLYALSYDQIAIARSRAAA